MAKMVAGVVKEELSVMESNDRRSAAGGEAGFALILALLALLLLTFLGLTLAVTTSTELQIATNYRWAEQARYVAEAGIEAGKMILRDAPTWENILPPPRETPWTGAAAPTMPTFGPRGPGFRELGLRQEGRRHGLRPRAEVRRDDLAVSERLPG